MLLGGMSNEVLDSSIAVVYIVQHGSRAVKLMHVGALYKQVGSTIN